MGLMILSVVCSFAAYIVGTAMEMIPGVNLPGLGIARCYYHGGIYHVPAEEQIRQSPADCRSRVSPGV